MTRSSSIARQPLSRVNLTGFTMQTSGKNRKYLSIQKKLENVFKNWLCPTFSCCPKNLSCQELLLFFGGGGGGGLQLPPHAPWPVRLCPELSWNNVNMKTNLLNNKTIVELGYGKISIFFSFWPPVSAYKWSAQNLQITKLLLLFELELSSSFLIGRKGRLNF